MAIIKLGAFITALSGKIGGQSIANRTNQTTIRNIVHTNKTSTPKQSIQRFQTARISNRFIFLSAIQKTAWNTAAPDYTYVNRIGDIVPRNGFGTFSFLNQNLNLIGQAIRNAPPIFSAAIAPTIVIDYFGLSTLEISAADSNTDYTYTLFASPSLSPGQTGQRGRMRYCGNISAADLLAGIDIVPLIETVFGTLDFPNNIGFYVSGINTITGNKAQAITILTQEVITGIPTTFDADYQAILDYAVLNGISTPIASEQTLQNQLMIDIKAILPLSAFDFLWITNGSGDMSFRMLNWRNPNQFQGGLTFGYAVNGIQGRFNNAVTAFTLAFNPSVDAIAYQLDDASIGCYTAVGGHLWSSSVGLFIANTGTGRTQMIGGTSIVGKINSALPATFGPSTTLGLLSAPLTYTIMRRINATTIQLVRDGVQIASVASNSNALPNENMIFGNSINNFRCTFTMMHAGRSITDVEALGLKNAFANYISLL